VIGLDVSDRSIKVIDLADGARHKLRTACWSPLAPNLMRRGVIQDPAGVVTSIQEALTRCTGASLRGSTAVVSIPETQSFVRALDLPLMNNRETDEAVQWAIRQHIPFDLDRVYIDWQPIPNPVSSDRQEVLVGAAQRDVIDPLLSAIDEVGLRVVALELEAQAIVRSLLPLDSQTINGIVIVDIGATSTNVIFFDRGSIRFTTSVQRGGDDLTQQLAQTLRMEPQQAAVTKTQTGGAEAVVDTLQSSALSLIRQIGQVVEEMTKKYSVGDGIKAILLSGGSANMPGMVELFTEVFPGIPIQVGNPFINLMIDPAKNDTPISQEDATHFATAIGLALRNVDYSERG
jgi:type IV pilus assembly protein PilM